MLTDPYSFIHNPDKILKFSYGANWDYSIYCRFFEAAVDIKNTFPDAKVHLDLDDRDHRTAVLIIRKPEYTSNFIDDIDQLIETSSALNTLELDGVLITTDFVEE